MRQFNAAPPVPIDYPRLRALTAEEIDQARIAGYAAESVELRAPVRRSGLDNCQEAGPTDDIQDWRIRMYVIWFCYVYEHYRVIPAPAYAIEELVLEFQAPEALDTGDLRVATAFAGAGGGLELLSPTEREDQLRALKPLYAAAIGLLEDWMSRQPAASADRRFSRE
jgi:hypothetical protein